MKRRAASASGAACGSHHPIAAAATVRNGQAQHRSGGRQHQAFGQQDGGHLHARRAKRAHDGQVVAPLVQRLRKRHEQHQRRRRDQQQRERADQVDAGSEHREKPRRFVGGRRGDQFRFLVDRARQARGGQRRPVFDERQRHFASRDGLGLRRRGRSACRVSRILCRTRLPCGLRGCAGLRMVGVIVVIAVMMLVHGPHAGDRRQHEPIEHRAGGRQHAGDRVARIAMLATAFGQAVRADEPVADAQLRRARDIAAQHGIERHAPQRALRQRAAVMRDEFAVRCRRCESPGSCRPAPAESPARSADSCAASRWPPAECCPAEHRRDTRPPARSAADCPWRRRPGRCPRRRASAVPRVRA